MSRARPSVAVPVPTTPVERRLTEVATIFRHGGGAMSTTISSSDNAGRNVASILGTEARIDVDATWYAPTSFSLLDSEDRVIERYVSDVPGRGMQFQADEIERLVAAGCLTGDILPSEESVVIMQTLDTIRGQIGLRYPGEQGARDQSVVGLQADAKPLPRLPVEQCGAHELRLPPGHRPPRTVAEYAAGGTVN